MKKRTSNLLEKAHSLVVSVTGTDISKTKRQDVMKDVRAIYRKIKEIEPKIYDTLNNDDNHKTTR